MSFWKNQTAKAVWKEIIPGLIDEEIPFRFDDPLEHLYIETKVSEVTRLQVENAISGALLMPDDDDPNQHRFSVKDVTDVGVEVLESKDCIEIRLLWPRESQ